MLKNTNDKYGILSKLLHWVIALAIIAQYAIIYTRHETPKENPLNLELILLHKSIGSTLLVLGILFLVWHIINIKPSYPSHMANFLKKIATGVRHSLFLCIILMPLTGALMSGFSGKTTLWFGLFEIPNILPSSKPLASFMYAAHGYISYILIALFVIHVLASLKHHFYDKDNVVKRMTF